MLIAVSGFAMAKPGIKEVAVFNNSKSVSEIIKTKKEVKVYPMTFCYEIGSTTTMDPGGSGMGVKTTTYRCVTYQM